MVRRFRHAPHRPMHIKEHLTHWAHEPLFWALLLLAVFILLTVIALMYAEPQAHGPYYYPMYMY